MIRVALVFVVGGLLAAGLLYDRLDRSGDIEVAAVEEATVITPSVSDPSRLDGAWFCPMGSSSAGGFADHEVQIVNFSDDPAVANVNIITGDGKGPTLRVEMAPLSTQQIPLSAISESDIAGAVVEIIGGTGAVAHSVTTAQGVAEGPCATHVSSSWLFASGRTTRDSRNYIALMNPFPEDVIYNVEFYRSAGRPRRPADLQGGVVRASSVALIEVETHIAREEAVAASITTVRGRLVAERLQVLDGALGPTGSALQLGVVAPAESWMLPAGRVHAEGADRVIVFNPSTEETATVDVELWPVNVTDRSLYGLGPIPRELLPGRFEIIELSAEADRFGIGLPFELGVSVTSTNGVPVVTERWHFAKAVDTSLIGAGGTEVAPTEDETTEEPADPDAAEDPDATGEPGDPDAEDTGEEESGIGESVAAEPDSPGELDVPGIIGSDGQELTQPTADAGVSTSRGSEVASTRWIIPWVATPNPDAATVVITSTQGASVEVRALVNGELFGPYLASIPPFGRAVVPLDIAATGAPVLVTADSPVSVEAQVVELGTRLLTLPGIPTVEQ